MRLIVEIELVLAQRLAEIVLQLAALLQRRIHGRLEEAEGVAAVLLGAVEREVGVLSSVSAASPSSGPMAMPMLAEVVTSWPLT